MAAAVTPLALVAASVLLAAGVGKLRSVRVPAVALLALGIPALSLPRARLAVRFFSLYEMGLGGLALIHPGPVALALLSLTYALLAAVAAGLARARADCGCFGEDSTPAGPLQPLLSLALAGLALAGAVAGARGVPWLAEHAPLWPVIVTGVAGAGYGVVQAYTRLPEAWGAWRPDAEAARGGAA